MPASISQSSQGCCKPRVSRLRARLAIYNPMKANLIIFGKRLAAVQTKWPIFQLWLWYYMYIKLKSKTSNNVYKLYLESQQKLPSFSWFFSAAVMCNVTHCNSDAALVATLWGFSLKHWNISERSTHSQHWQQHYGDLAWNIETFLRGWLMRSTGSSIMGICNIETFLRGALMHSTGSSIMGI